MFHNKHQSTAIHLSDTIYHCFCDKHWSKIKGAAQTRGGGACSSLPPALSLSLPLNTFMFTGATCEIQIDECQSQPCLNGARCHDYTDGFACICPSGFQGHKCEFNTDECQEQPCKNGAPCVDGVNGCEILSILLLQRQKSIFNDIFLVSATAVTALTQPSQARTARRRCRRVTLHPASTAPPVRTTTVTTPVCAGQVHVSEFKTASHPNINQSVNLHLYKVCYHVVSISNTSNILEIYPEKAIKVMTI